MTDVERQLEALARSAGRVGHLPAASQVRRRGVRRRRRRTVGTAVAAVAVVVAGVGVAPAVVDALRGGDEVTAAAPPAGDPLSSLLGIRQVVVAAGPDGGRARLLVVQDGGALSASASDPAEATALALLPVDSQGGETTVRVVLGDGEESQCLTAVAGRLEMQPCDDSEPDQLLTLETAPDGVAFGLRTEAGAVVVEGRDVVVGGGPPTLLSADDRGRYSPPA